MINPYDESKNDLFEAKYQAGLKNNVIFWKDEWIDLCSQKHKGCKGYLFVVDETEKYKDKIVETLTNKSHFGTNFEYVVFI